MSSSRYWYSSVEVYEARRFQAMGQLNLMCTHYSQPNHVAAREAELFQRSRACPAVPRVPRPVVESRVAQKAQQNTRLHTRASAEVEGLERVVWTRREG
jgi:hypothetical protein